MNQTAIFSPVFAMLLLTFVVWAYMYSRRIPFIRGNDFGPDEFAPAEFTRLSPPAVANPSDNLKNLFEIPVIFYVLAIYLFATGNVDATHLVSSWTFVTFRVLHSAVHCTINIVMLRFCLYLISSLCVALIGCRAALQHFG
ncbi:MAG: MAPEG family protein [Gammaproteobacteria bacterium]|nr:MAPEG family protein [Gammaproteobacteria bacterium]